MLIVSSLIITRYGVKNVNHVTNSTSNPKHGTCGQPDNRTTGLADFFHMLIVMALAILIGVCIGAGL